MVEICPHEEIRLVTKINTFFIVFHFDDDEHGLKIEKSKTASKFWYIYGSVTFFCLSGFFIFFPFSAVSLLHLFKSLRRRRATSARLSVHPCVWTCCVGRFLFLFPASCLSVGGAEVVSMSSTQGRAGRDSHLAMYTFMVGPWLPTNGSTISEGLIHTPGTEQRSIVTPGLSQ